jgi:hypothetical protein
MRNGFAFLGTVATLLVVSVLGISGTMRGNTRLLPEGTICIQCTGCSYEVIVGGEPVTRWGHEAIQRTVTVAGTTGKGGAPHECVAGGTDTACFAPQHPTVTCKVSEQAVLPALPLEQQMRLAQLSKEVYEGSAEAFTALRTEFNDRIVVDARGGVVLFKGCREGVFAGILPIPTHTA